MFQESISTIDVTQKHT